VKLASGGVLLGVAAIVVVAAIFAGIVALGPPSEERARRLDSRRVSDLQRLSSAVLYYRNHKERLPASLDELSSLANVSVDVRDPERDQPYGFRVLDDMSYQLCAMFARESKEEQRSHGREFWAHGAGTHCFTLKVPNKQQ
jgi:hypothetical protein